MTAAVKDELSRLSVTKPCCRKSEVSSLLRFAGGLHIVRGRIVVEAELDTGVTARRLRRDIAEVFGHASDVAVVAPGGLRKGSRYVVRVVKDGEALARQTGLIDGRGRPVRGLPPQVVSGAMCDAEAAWRGAFLAHGSLTEPGARRPSRSPAPAPRRHSHSSGRPAGSASQPRPRGARCRPGGHPRRRGDRRHAHPARRPRRADGLEERRMRREVRATANRLANFDDANLRRSARAAVAAGSRVERAMEILGAEVPDHLREAGTCVSRTSRPASKSSVSSPTRR
jgi:DNA-binding transcriptional regulator WhiA